LRGDAEASQSPQREGRGLAWERAVDEDGGGTLSRARAYHQLRGPGLRFVASTVGDAGDDKMIGGSFLVPRAADGCAYRRNSQADGSWSSDITPAGR